MKRLTTLAAVGAAFAVAAPAADALPKKPDSPSAAPFIANCKSLETVGVPQIGAPPIAYPYAFYGNDHLPAYVAKNRAGCVRVLRALHGGEIPPGPQEG